MDPQSANCAGKLPTQLARAGKASVARQPNATAALASPGTFGAVPLPAFLHGNAFAATFASGFVTSIAMYPVDVLRAVTMAQASANDGGSLLSAFVKFQRAHGWGGFIKQGAAQEVMRSTTMQSLKFFLFPIFHEALFDVDERQGTAASRATAGATCAIIEGLMIGPLEVAKVGLQLDATNQFKNSGLTVVRQVVRARGPYAAYTGYLGVQWRQSSWTGAFFGSLRFFEQRVDAALALLGVRRQDVPSLQPVHKVLSGFMAGAFASLFNCPADVVRTNVQKEAIAAAAAAAAAGESAARPLTLREFSASEFESHWRIGRGIVAAKGFSGLYAGYFTKAGHLGGCGALMALLVPRFKMMVGCAAC